MKHSRIAIVIILLTATFEASAQCISPDQLKAKLKQAQAATVKLENDGAQGTGFYVRSKKSVELVTAHHVPSQGEAEPYCADAKITKYPLQDKDKSTFEPKIHQLAQLTVDGQPSAKFKVNPGDYNWGYDAIKVPVKNRKAARSLPVTSKDSTLSLESSITIMGFPAARKGFQSENCSFKGYTRSASYAANPVYAVDCPQLKYDIAGMSGGPVISNCTGEVIGFVSAQDYDGDCPDRGNPTLVWVSPVHSSEQGVEFGVNKTIFDTRCVYLEEISGKPNSRSCNVTPGMFSDAPVSGQEPPTGEAAR